MSNSRQLLARVAPLGLCLLVTCAAPLGPVLIDGQMVPRQQMTYVGQPYSVRHLDAYPRAVGASSGLMVQGGRITGVVCGADIEYSVSHDGDRIRLVGFVDQQYNSHLEVSDKDGYNVITGSVAYREVNLQLFSNRLRGFIGRCSVDMVQDGDALVETRYAGAPSEQNAMHLRMNGLDALWKMPPADQAAVLPLVTQCLIDKMFDNFGRENPPAMTFGGPAGAVPRDTIRFGISTTRRSCDGDATRSSSRPY